MPEISDPGGGDPAPEAAALPVGDLSSSGNLAPDRWPGAAPSMTAQRALAAPATVDRAARIAEVVWSTGACAGLSYQAAVVDRALTLAGVPPAAPRTLAQVAAATGTGRGALLVGAAGVATALAQAAPAIQALGDLAPVVAIAVVLATVAGVLAWRLGRPA
jgi:hypothetical protein